MTTQLFLTCQSKINYTLKSFHTQHRSKQNQPGPGWGPSAPAPGSGGVRTAPGTGGRRGGTGLVPSCSPRRLLALFSGAGGERGGWVRVPGRWRAAAACFHRGGGVRPKGRQAGSAWLPSHRGFWLGTASPGLPKIVQNPAPGWEFRWLAPQPSCFAFADFPGAARVCTGRAGKCPHT